MRRLLLLAGVNALLACSAQPSAALAQPHCALALAQISIERVPCWPCAAASALTSSSGVLCVGTTATSFSQLSALSPEVGLWACQIVTKIPQYTQGQHRTATLPQMNASLAPLMEAREWPAWVTNVTSASGERNEYRTGYRAYFECSCTGPKRCARAPRRKPSQGRPAWVRPADRGTRGERRRALGR